MQQPALTSSGQTGGDGGSAVNGTTNQRRGGLSPESFLIRSNLRSLVMFSEGREEDAFAVFRESIAFGYQAVGRRLGRSTEQRPHILMTTLSLDEIVWPLGDESETGEGHHAGRSHSNESYFTMYPHVFLFEEEESTEDSSRGDCPFISLEHLCAIISYNFAVLLHQIGMVRRTNVLGRCFSTSRCYYHQALQMWESSSEEDRIHAERNNRYSLMRFVLALFNNTGHLAALAGDDAELTSSREDLETALMRAAVLRAEDDRILETADQSFFSSSLNKARQHTPQNAAAA